MATLSRRVTSIERTRTREVMLVFCGGGFGLRVLPIFLKLPDDAAAAGFRGARVNEATLLVTDAAGGGPYDPDEVPVPPAAPSPPARDNVIETTAEDVRDMSPMLVLDVTAAIGVAAAVAMLLSGKGSKPLVVVEDPSMVVEWSKTVLPMSSVVSTTV